MDFSSGKKKVCITLFNTLEEERDERRNKMKETKRKGNKVRKRKMVIVIDLRERKYLWRKESKNSG